MHVAAAIQGIWDGFPICVAGGDAASSYGDFDDICWDSSSSESNEEGPQLTIRVVRSQTLLELCISCACGCGCGCGCERRGYAREREGACERERESERARERERENERERGRERKRESKNKREREESMLKRERGVYAQVCAYNVQTAVSNDRHIATTLAPLIQRLLRCVWHPSYKREQERDMRGAGAGVQGRGRGGWARRTALLLDKAWYRALAWLNTDTDTD